MLRRYAGWAALLLTVVLGLIFGFAALFSGDLLSALFFVCISFGIVSLFVAYVLYKKKDRRWRYFCIAGAILIVIYYILGSSGLAFS